MSDPRWRIRQTDSGLEVALHVQPRARRDEIVGVHNGALKLKVSAPPVDDAANRAVIEFFAALLDVPKTRLQIVAGLKSREKVLRIESVSMSDFCRHFPGL
jgi:uncharacterized protein (TIGR00251 family)